MRDPSDFDAFYAGSVRRLISQMYAITGDRAEAEDLVQEAFARAWQSWEKVSGYNDPEAWVRTVACRVRVSVWRKTVNRLAAHRRHGIADDVAGVGADYVAIVVALRRIPAEQRRAIVLHHYGMPALADGEGGLVCTAALCLYLLVLRAGRALVGVVAVLGVCLVLQIPQAAAGAVLAKRGRVAAVVVTSVEERTAVSGRGRYLCSVADREGGSLRVRIWRGCGQATRPGDDLAVAYDPEGRVSPRGVEAGTSSWGRLGTLSGWALAFAGSSVAAVVGSYRLPSSDGSTAGSDGLTGPAAKGVRKRWGRPC
ncbi:sigma factor [Streptomyces sp. NPDC005574]|uniref:sigma factor n=1 Tax=Streptomyces sp. NPDC005574 TaxID=3156891 RepID=UPI0033B7C458